MKLDVTDLFDHLYDVASFARARFNLSQSRNPDLPSDEWQDFCNTLSERLFLPACAARVFDLTHTRMEPSDLAGRIITEMMPPSGVQIDYSRYTRPYFDGSSRFIATPIDESYEVGPLSSTRCPLTLWLGKLPPKRIAVTPPPYPTNLSEPFRYAVHQYMGMYGPRISYYELHGDWCLREVELIEATFVRQSLGGQWRKFDDLKSIGRADFEKVWDAAKDDNS
jgi:hypothetical protein